MPARRFMSELPHPPVEARAAARGRGRRLLLVMLLLAGVVAVPLLAAWPTAPVAATSRALVAPADTIVRRVLVHPGDWVYQGQLLIDFEQRDLQVECSLLRAELAAAGDARTDRLDEARAMLALLDQRLARAELTAPIDGVVADIDPVPTVGRAVHHGEVLLTIEPVRAAVERVDVAWWR